MVLAKTLTGWCSFLLRNLLEAALNPRLTPLGHSSCLNEGVVNPGSLLRLVAGRPAPVLIPDVVSEFRATKQA